MMKQYSLKHLSVFMLLFAACAKKDSDVFVPNPGQQLDSAWVSALSATSQVVQLANNIAGTASVTDLNLAVDSVIRTPAGLTVECPRESLFVGTNVATGIIKAEYVLIQKKGDFIRYGVPTVSNRFPLESGGAVYLKLTNASGTAVTVSPSKKIYFKYADSTAKQGMSLFYAGLSPTASSLVNWLPTNDGSVVTTWPSNTAPFKGYVFATSRTGWLNVDRLYEPALPTTETSVVMPNLFSNANTSVYMVFKNYKTVLHMGGSADVRKFSHTNIPLNFDVKIITISKVANTYYLGVKDDKITPNYSTFIRPDVSNIDKINQLINSL